MITPAELHGALRNEMEDPATGRGGAQVVDLADNSPVFQHDHLTPRLMASTTKIFTAAASISDLGSRTRFHTRLLAGERPDANGELAGDLFIVGGGDPTLGDPEHVNATYLGNGTADGRIVESLAAAGVRRITGRVVGDDALFRSDSDQAPHVAALTYNRSRKDRPALYAAQRITQTLVEAGISVEEAAAEGTATPGMYELGTVASPPVMNLLIRMGHESDNYLAETFTKHLAAQNQCGHTSTKAGAAVLERFGADNGAVVDLTNGSGMGPANYGSPSGITHFLTAMNRSPYAAKFAQTLPRAGVDGTLKYRMRNTLASESVRAKTGTLTKKMKRQPLQDSLAGYVRGPNRALAFSFVFEEAETRYAARASLDRMAGALAAFCWERRGRNPWNAFKGALVRKGLRPPGV